MAKIKQAQQFLKAARKAATFERASFGSLGDGVITLRTPEEVDAFIKERTRLYRETWILPYLDSVDDILNGKPVSRTPRS